MGAEHEVTTWYLEMLNQSALLPARTPAWEHRVERARRPSAAFARFLYATVGGHYGCGGVRAALVGGRFGLIDNWLRHVQDVYVDHRGLVDGAATEDERVDRLCELNVLEQALNVCDTTIVRDAWTRGQSLAVHTWIYGLSDGRLRDLGFTATADAEVVPMFGAAVRGVGGNRDEPPS